MCWYLFSRGWWLVGLAICRACHGGRNCDQGDVDDAKIRATIDAITDSSRGTSLLKLGFRDVGVDDGWQACGTGAPLASGKKTFHSVTGAPLVNKTKFPDVKALVDYGHKRGVTMGWYDNNCICNDNGEIYGQDPHWFEKCMAGDVEFLLENGFDSVRGTRMRGRHSIHAMCRKTDTWQSILTGERSLLL
eukprot:COSAG01_NODE_60_length_29981_cov_23.262533_39_plen_190_part_00